MRSCVKAKAGSKPPRTHASFREGGGVKLDTDRTYLTATDNRARDKSWKQALAFYKCIQMQKLGLMAKLPKTSRKPHDDMRVIHLHAQQVSKGRGGNIKLGIGALSLKLNVPYRCRVLVRLLFRLSVTSCPISCACVCAKRNGNLQLPDF